MKLHGIPLAFVLLASMIGPVATWQACDGGGFCPDGNTCCAASDQTGRSTCITGKYDDVGEGSCCTDTPGPTGCGVDFFCAFDEQKDYHYCQKMNDTDAADDKPDRLPRYRLCSLPDKALKEVYGLPIDGISNDLQAAYMSTMGALNAADPETLQQHQAVETLLIMVHGSGRNVDDYLCCANAALPALQQDPATSTYMVVAPWFLAPEDDFVNITTQPTVEPIRWAEFGPIYHTWRYGADAVNANVSSYAITDAIIQKVLQDTVRFPSLKRIVVAGHSAGGQYTQRWALLSNGSAFPNTAVGYIPRAPTRVVVANPKSFCFLDERRWVNGSFQVPDVEDYCDWYNEWEWGLGKGDWLKTPYKDQAIKTAGGTDAIVRRYPSRDIHYLAGELDVIPNGECQARMQGEYRRERSEHFMESLREIYGRPVHRRLVVSGVHHDHCLMFQSPEGQQAMFGHGASRWLRGK